MAIWKINFILVSLSLQCLAHSIPNVQVPETALVNNAQNQNYVNSANIPVAVHEANTQGVPGNQKIENIPTAYAVNVQSHQIGYTQNVPGSQNIENVQRTYAVTQGAEHYVWSNPQRNNLPTNLNVTSADEQDTQIPGTHNENGENQNNDINVSEAISIYQLLEELLEDEDFWDLLSMWTEAYTAVLDEHINSAVQEEVSRQIKKYFENNEVNFVNDDENDEYEENKRDCDEYLDKKIRINNNKPTNLIKHKNRPNHEAYNKHNNKNELIKEHNIYNSTFGNDYITNIYISYHDKENKTGKNATQDAGFDIRVGYDNEIKINERDSNNDNANKDVNSFVNKSILNNIKLNLDQIKSNEYINESRGNLKSILRKEYANKK